MLGTNCTNYRMLTFLASLTLVLSLTGCGKGNDVYHGNGASAPLTVQTRDGKVTGVHKDSMRAFLGIPYAAPPVGKLRWKAPQPVHPWPNTLAANKFAPHCPQLNSPFGQPSDNEDCLYLNVFAPEDHRTHPVMFWIHGGALTTGESDDYNPMFFVQRGVVVVTINYRLGMLGFLALPALTSESKSGHDSGNYGLLDQQAALRWVQDNIARFGGNPDNVTIFGESAGGLSVLAQLASPAAKGLFQKAIVESGSYAPQQTTLTKGEQKGMKFATNVGCPNAKLKCMRQVPVQKILQQQGGSIAGFSPKAGTPTLPHSVLTAFQTGNFKKNIPVMAGTNRNEFRLFTAILFDLAKGPLTKKQYESLQSPAVLAEYPLSDFSSPDLAYSAVQTDSAFACPGQREVLALANQGVRTYAYEFNDPTAPEVFLPTDKVSFSFGSAHSSEIPYLFEAFDRKKILANPTIQLTPKQKKLSETMVGYWTRFAKTGNPNPPSGAAPFWPEYSSKKQYMSLMPPAPAPITDFSGEHHCGFWDNH